ncbi:hypothetical protein CARUB_v10015542mg [Capsella rubella]|uniref:Uncharacterized protein n=1 Tax=Capsella rubella TaxID=81985 RepID=R0G9Q3_9BRAS|nr:hypothetical protein CARUB_v10015542mg [Capsella rubella]
MIFFGYTLYTNQQYPKRHKARELLTFNEAKIKIKKKKKNLKIKSSSHESNKRNGNSGVIIPATTLNYWKRRLRLTESFFYCFSHGGDENNSNFHQFDANL